VAQAGISRGLGSLIRKIVAGAALAALASSSIRGSLAAQSQHSVFVATGLSFPAGVFGAYANTGWTIDAGYELQFGKHPTSIRIDAGLSRNGDTNSVGFKENTRLVRAMASVVYRFKGARPRIYVLAGAGLLAHRFSSEDPDELTMDDSNFAMQLGEGVTFGIGSARFFVEGRFVTTTAGQQSLRYFPVTFGVRLGGSAD
jgi:hypothetical protein